MLQKKKSGWKHHKLSKQIKGFYKKENSHRTLVGSVVTGICGH